MSEDEWGQLSWLCGSDVPEEYMRLLQNYPPPLLQLQRGTSEAQNEGLISEVELLCQLSEVIAINQEARSTSILDPEGEEFIWPEQLLIIGETGTGDYYCLDVSGEHVGVLQFRHQAVEFEVVADSLDEFVELVETAFDESGEADETDPDEFDDDQADDEE